MSGKRLADSVVQETRTALEMASNNVTQAAKLLGISRSTMQNRVRSMNKQEKKQAKKEASPEALSPKSIGRSMREFRKEFDKDLIVPNKIRAGLKALGAGWEYEVPFAKASGISLQDLAIYREQFADHVVLIRRDSKRAWAGTVDIANEMKGILS